MSTKWQRDYFQLTNIMYKKQAEHTMILNSIKQKIKEPVDLSDTIFILAGDTLSKLETEICQIQEILNIISNISTINTLNEE